MQQDAKDATTDDSPRGRSIRIIALQLLKQRGMPPSSTLRGTLAKGPGMMRDLPDEIIPRLYLGDFMHATDESALTRLGITHVVSVLETSPSFDFESGYGNRLVKLHLPLHDSPFTVISKHFQQSNIFIQTALEDPKAAVFVHCFQGISRSATIIAAYLLATEARFTSAEDVVQFMREKRCVVSPNYGFMLQLDTYAGSKSRLALFNEKTVQADQGDNTEGHVLEATEVEQVAIGDGTAVVAGSASITREASDTVYTKQ